MANVQTRKVGFKILQECVTWCRMFVFLFRSLSWAVMELHYRYLCPPSWDVSDGRIPAKLECLKRNVSSLSLVSQWTQLALSWRVSFGPLLLQRGAGRRPFVTLLLSFYWRLGNVRRNGIVGMELSLGFSCVVDAENSVFSHHTLNRTSRPSK